MARYAIINGSTVENVIEATSKVAIAGRTIVQSDTANPGDFYDGVRFTPRVPTARETAKGNATPNIANLYQAARNRSAQLRSVAQALAAPMTVAQTQQLLRFVADLYDFDADLLLQLDLDGN
jgi:hypothetical protein